MGIKSGWTGTPKYAIKLARLNPKTGETEHQLVAGTDDLDKFNETDLKPFIDAFKKNDVQFDDNPIEREIARRKKEGESSELETGNGA